MLSVTRYSIRLKNEIKLNRLFFSYRRYSFTSNEQNTHNEQDYMRKVLQKTSGCVLYHPDKHLEYIMSPTTFRMENQIIVNLVTEIRKVHLYKRLNDVSLNEKLLTPLNEQCLDNYKTWPINEQLFALDAWHSFKHVNNFSFFNVALSDFLQNFDHLTNGPALQTMYYVAYAKWKFKPNEETTVIKKLEEIVNELTFDEVSIYCLALIKSECELNRSNLVKSLYKCLMKADFRNHDDIGVTGLIKAVRRFSTTSHMPELKDLQKKLVPFAQEANLKSLTHIIQLGSKQRAFNQQLIDVIIKRFLCNLDNLRNKDVERALLAISTFNQRTKNDIENEFVDNVQKYLLMSLDTKFPTSIIRCISYLAILGVADKRLVDWALNPYTHSIAYGESISADEHALLLIDAYAKINLSATYDGHKLSEKLCAKLMPKVTENNATGQSSEFANEFRHVLITNEVDCLLSKPLPYTPFPDVFFVYNKRTNKTIGPIKGNADGSILKASNLHKNSSNVEAVAIVPCLQRQTVFESNRYNGLFQFKLDQLKSLGFKVIVIKQTIWNCYKSAEAKRRYLALELCRNDIFLLNKAVNFIFKTVKRSKKNYE